MNEYEYAVSLNEEYNYLSIDNSLGLVGYSDSDLIEELKNRGYKVKDQNE